MALVESNEPDGNINWEEFIVDSDNTDSDSSFSKSSSLAHNELECNFSSMYENNQIKEDELLYDPPASNTRRRKRRP